MIRLENTPQGTRIAVRAQPGAKRNSLLGEHDGALRVAVTAAPDKGKANQAIVELLAHAFGLPKSAVELVSGHASRQKKFLLVGLEISEVTEILQGIVVSDQ